MVESAGIGLAFSSFSQGMQDARAARNSGGGGYNIAETDKMVAELAAQRDKNYDSAIINNARYVGASAQIEELKAALKAVSPSHSLLQPSGQKYKDGDSKTKLRLFFEEAFDKELRRIGGAFGVNPKS